MYFIHFDVNLVLKNLKQLNIIHFTLVIIVKGLWLNLEQATEEYVINNLSMELWVQVLAGLEAKRYKRMRRIIANAGDFTGLM